MFIGVVGSLNESLFEGVNGDRLATFLLIVTLGTFAIGLGMVTVALWQACRLSGERIQHDRSLSLPVNYREQQRSSLLDDEQSDGAVQSPAESAERQKADHEQEEKPKHRRKRRPRVSAASTDEMLDEILPRAPGSSSDEDAVS